MAMPYFMRSASQVDRGVVRASGERPDLCLEIRAVELLGVRQGPGLPLETPRLRMEGLRALEERHGRLGMAAGVKVLRETKRRGSQCVPGGRQEQALASLLRVEHVAARGAPLRPVAHGGQIARHVEFRELDPPVVREGRLIGADDAPLFVDPYGR